MFEACLTAPDPGFAVIHGVSANTRGWWDLGPGRALGYEPQDDAELYADQVDDSGPSEADDVESRFVGGTHATPELHRPAQEPRSASTG